MSDKVRDSYDAVAELYATVALGDLDPATPDRAWLSEFARLAALGDGAVADLGCGPGHVTNFLSELGLTAVGYDISPAQIAEARHAFPDLNFQIADLAALDVASSSLAGIVARYSLIHAPPRQLFSIFKEWSDLLEFGAPVLVSFFAASSAQRHGSPFNHAVVTAYELFPATIVTELQNAGFDRVEVGTRAPLDGERPLNHGTVLARSASAG